MYCNNEDEEITLRSKYSSSDESGSEQRFHRIIEKLKNKNNGVYKYRFWWIVHNCLAHFMIGIFPCKFSFKFRDYTSKKIYGE